MTIATQQLADLRRVKPREGGIEKVKLADDIGLGRTGVVNWDNAHDIPLPHSQDAIAGAVNADPEGLRQLLAEKY